MSQRLRIALAQCTCGSNLEQTLHRGAAFCRQAAENSADILLFPEMFTNGYAITQTPPEIWKQDAIGLDHPFLKSFQKLAKELNLAIGITFLEKDGEDFYNSLLLFDCSGLQVLHYRKVHTCDFAAERALSRGDVFPVCTLQTRSGSIQTGAMICYDREFPESARILMLQGAELILVPNACPMEINRLSQLCGRAYENMLAIATCNYPADVPDCNGHSSVFDGVAYLEDLPGSRDTCLLEAPEKEGLYFADLDLEQLREYRAREVHGNAWRRPELYDALCAQEVNPPFIRKRRNNETESDRKDKE